MENETIKLITKAQAGDIKAREILMTDNAGLVINIAKRYIGRGYDLEDIISLGNIGLLKAINKFNTEYDYMFSTYAVPLINGEIKRFLRDDGMIKVSRLQKENAWKISYTRDKYLKNMGREPTLTEIENDTSLDKEAIFMALDANKSVESIYKNVGNNNNKDLLLLDTICDEKDEGELLLNQMLVKSLIDELDEYEKQLIKYRYFDNMTQAHVGQILNLSQVKVSRLEKKILLKLRKFVIQ